MAHYRKLYEKIKNNPKHVEFEEIDTLLRKIGGFERRNPKSGSTHYTYSHPDLKDILTISKDKPIKPVYIKRAIDAFDQVVEDFINKKG